MMSTDVQHDGLPPKVQKKSDTLKRKCSHCSCEQKVQQHAHCDDDGGKAGGGDPVLCDLNLAGVDEFD